MHSWLLSPAVHMIVHILWLAANVDYMYVEISVEHHVIDTRPSTILRHIVGAWHHSFWKRRTVKKVQYPERVAR